MTFGRKQNDKYKMVKDAYSRRHLSVPDNPELPAHMIQARHSIQIDNGDFKFSDDPIKQGKLTIPKLVLPLLKPIVNSARKKNSPLKGLSGLKVSGLKNKNELEQDGLGGEVAGMTSTSQTFYFENINQNKKLPLNNT